MKKMYPKYIYFLILPCLLVYLAYRNPKINKREILLNNAITATIQEDSSANTHLMKKLIAAYPQQLKDFDSLAIIWKDGTRMLFDDGKKKNIDEMMENPDLEDIFYFPYPKKLPADTPAVNEDPGRIRNTAFFKKMYGNTQLEVIKNIVEVKWLPKTLNKTIKVTTINGVDKKIAQISAELDTMKAFRKYLETPGGGFYWRMIAGTTQLSAHSFGIAVDIDVKYSNYWRWTANKDLIQYKNRIPDEIVKVFEKNGFIWGGKWYHYDTMHFEYRPEFFVE